MVSFVAPAHVEVAIRPEVKIAAIVIPGVVSLLDENVFGIGIGNSVGNVGIVPTGETLIAGSTGLHIVDGEEVSVGGIVGMEIHREESLLTSG